MSPSRPPSHRIGDKAIVNFCSNIPDLWVYRTKDKDYGVDVEVEIFDELGTATGLVFYAQVKGTENFSHRRKADIKVGTLHYLASFEVPSIVVRCCNRTKAIFWIWVDEALKQITGDQKTASIRLSRQWDDASAREIADIVSRRRMLRSASQQSRVQLSIQYPADFSSRFAAQESLEELYSSLPFLRPKKESTKLTLDVIFGHDALTISFGDTAGLLIEVNPADIESLKDALGYGLLAACWNMGLTDRAREVARHCLGSERVAPDKRLAIVGVAALRQDADDALDLAVLNRFHTVQDEFYRATIESVIGGQGDFFESEALRRFYLEAIKAQGDGVQVAPIYYSIANLFMMRGDRWNAFANLNKARRLRPKFMDEAHFLSEFAASLFACGRYRMAVKLYNNLYEIEPTEGNAFRLADACYFAERYDDAIRYFDIALHEVNDEVLRAEATLKLLLCEASVDSDHVGPPSQNARLHLDRLDSELSCSLSDAFNEPTDEALWAACMWGAASKHRYDLSEFSIICATRACGSKPYALFRDTFGSVLHIETLAKLDAISFRARTLIDDWQPEWAEADRIQQGGIEVSRF